MFVDTATFYPISIADLVLRLAEIGIFELIWSDHLFDEIERVLVERKRLPRPASAYFCACIRETFPGGRIPRTAYEHLLASRTGPDPADHEHSAAAVAGNATVVLSADRTGFPIRDTTPARRRHPDEYLAELLGIFSNRDRRRTHRYGLQPPKPVIGRRHHRRAETCGTSPFRSKRDHAVQ